MPELLTAKKQKRCPGIQIQRSLAKGRRLTGSKKSKISVWSFTSELTEQRFQKSHTTRDNKHPNRSKPGKSLNKQTATKKDKATTANSGKEWKKSD